MAFVDRRGLDQHRSAGAAGVRAAGDPGPGLHLGRRATGPGVTTAITGCRAPGCCRRRPGYLWTPGYWGWDDGVYCGMPAIGARDVGFYGGVNYGFGYTGDRLRRRLLGSRRFFYNRAVNHIRQRPHHQRLQQDRRQQHHRQSRELQRRQRRHPGAARRRQELAAQREPHLQPVSAQLQHEQAARSNPAAARQRPTTATRRSPRPRVPAMFRARRGRSRTRDGRAPRGRSCAMACANALALKRARPGARTGVHRAAAAHGVQPAGRRPGAPASTTAHAAVQAPRHASGTREASRQAQTHGAASPAATRGPCRQRDRQGQGRAAARRGTAAQGHERPQ